MGTLKAGDVNNTISYPLYNADGMTPFDASTYNAFFVTYQKPDGTFETLSSATTPAVTLQQQILKAGTITALGLPLAADTTFWVVQHLTAATTFPAKGVYEYEVKLTAADGSVSRSLSGTINIDRSIS